LALSAENWHLQSFLLDTFVSLLRQPTFSAHFDSKERIAHLQPVAGFRVDIRDRLSATCGLVFTKLM